MLKYILKKPSETLLSQQPSSSDQAQFSAAAAVDSGIKGVRVFHMDDHQSKHIFAEVRIHASVEQVWRVITDYDNLADFVPNLVVSERLPSNVTGRIQLRQIGCSQSVFWRLEAEAVLECVEVHKAMGAKELRFKAVEGDFQVSIACLAMQIPPSAPLCVHQFILHASCMTCCCLSSSKHMLRCSSTMQRMF